MNHSARAFTLVEIIIVIVVLGILVTLATLGMTKVQESARNSQRKAATLQVAEALEKYYDEHGEYPACTSLQAPLTTITTTTLKGIESNALIAPKAPNKNTSSIICSTLSTSDAYAYIGDASPPCTTGVACLSWKLQYREEGSGSIKEITSRRSGNVAVSDPSGSGGGGSTPTTPTPTPDPDPYPSTPSPQPCTIGGWTRYPALDDWTESSPPGTYIPFLSSSFGSPRGPITSGPCATAEPESNTVWCSTPIASRVAGSLQGWNGACGRLYRATMYVTNTRVYNGTCTTTSPPCYRGEAYVRTATPSS